MKRGWQLVGALVLLSGIAAVQAAAATSGAPATPAPTGNAPAAATAVALTSAPARNGMVSLQAKVTGPGGQAVSNQTVVFEQMTNFFGERPARVGTETTDTGGTATLIYNPTVEGTYRLRARFLGGPGLAASAGETSVSVQGNATDAEEGAHRLEPIWLMTMIAAAVVTTAVWVIMLAIVVRVRRSLA